jgi:hypothetical protein
MGKGLAMTGGVLLSLQASFVTRSVLFRKKSKLRADTVIASTAKQSKLIAHHKIQPWDRYRNISTTFQI